MVSQKKQLKDKENITVQLADALKLSHIEDKTVNRVISDPPWGFYEDIGDMYEFYKKMFTSFSRVLKEDGEMIILSARKEEIEKAALEMNIKTIDSLHTLVNGKKASLYKFSFN